MKFSFWYLKLFLTIEPLKKIFGEYLIWKQASVPLQFWRTLSYKIVRDFLATQVSFFIQWSRLHFNFNFQGQLDLKLQSQSNKDKNFSFLSEIINENGFSEPKRCNIILKRSDQKWIRFRLNKSKTLCSFFFCQTISSKGQLLTLSSQALASASIYFAWNMSKLA